MGARQVVGFQQLKRKHVMLACLALHDATGSHPSLLPRPSPSFPTRNPQGGRAWEQVIITPTPLFWWWGLALFIAHCVAGIHVNAGLFLGSPSPCIIIPQTTFDEGRLKVICGIRARKEGEPGNKASADQHLSCVGIYQTVFLTDKIEP